MTESTTVYIIDDDDAVRDSLKMLLEASQLNVIAYSDATTFLESFQGSNRACLILDIRMPGMSGFELQAELNRRGITIPIIFLTAYGDIPMTVRAIQAGAVDFLTKPVETGLLLDRVMEILQKDEILQEIAEYEGHELLASLSRRELEIARLLIEGYTGNKKIAKQLGISHRTVENHRARIKEKTNTTNLIELVRLFGKY